MIRDPVTQIKAAEPAIREVQMHLFTQPALGPDAEAIPDQQHPDQQLGIERRAACVAVETGKIGADAAQIDKPINGPKQVILRNMILQRELVEKCCLRFLSRSQHCSILPLVRRIESAVQTSIKEEFFNKIRPPYRWLSRSRRKLSMRGEGAKGPHSGPTRFADTPKF